MARREITGNWTRYDRIAINENFRQLFEEYVGAGLDAKEARQKAHDAVMKSDEALALSERTQKELSQAILEGDSSPLGGQLSVGADGTVYNDPQDRLVNEFNSVNQQLAQSEIDSAVKFNDIGYTMAPINHKLVYKTDDNEYRVISRRPDGVGYVLMRFRKGRGNQADSNNYGDTWDLLRLDSVRHLSEVLVYNQPDSYISSQLHTSGQNDFRNQNFTTGYTFPTTAVFLSNTGREKQGAFLEFETTITKAHKGWLYLGFYGTPAANNNLSVYINDELIDTIDTSLPTAGMKTIGLDIGTVLGKIKVRLQAANDSTATRGIHFLGSNLFNLNEVEQNLDFNGALWRDSGASYITQSSGANDYAFKEAATGKWAGSYHGGESLINLTMFLDGTDIVNLPSNSYRVGKNFTLIQTTDIIGKVESQTLTQITNDGTFHLDVRFSVPIPFEVIDFYTTMTCTNNDFTEVVYPRRATLSSTSHTANLPNTRRVIQRKPITNQMVTTVYSPLANYKTNTPLYVQWSQYYAKVYHGVAQGRNRLLNSMNFGSVKIFN